MLSHNKLQSFRWVPTEKQLVDCLTKQGTNSLNLTNTFVKGFKNLYIDCSTIPRFSTILLCYLPEHYRH